MRFVTAGESHGPAVVALVSDVPVGFSLSSAAINADLARRQSGYGRGGRMAIEQDSVRILSGLRFGRTLGSPIALEVSNRDWENWSTRMAQEGKPPADLMAEHAPRPGHADLVGAQKTGSKDCRDILERASARETAARVAAGAVARAYLANFGVEVHSYVTRIGRVELPEQIIARKGGVFSADKVESSPVRCPDAQTSDAMVALIDQAKAAGDSLGGWFNVTATGLVPGIGGYAEAGSRLTSQLGQALFSIPALKGVEFGLGFVAGTLPGSQVHDPIINSSDSGRIQPVRASNHAGGLEGGMTNGEPLLVRAAMKPIPTMTTPLPTVDLVTHQSTAASRERSDVCAVPACAVVAEAEVCMVLANAYMDAFGRANLSRALAAFGAYADELNRR